MNQINDIQETIQMIRDENLDIRTVTMDIASRLRKERP